MISCAVEYSVFHKSGRTLFHKSWRFFAYQWKRFGCLDDFSRPSLRQRNRISIWLSKEIVAFDLTFQTYGKLLLKIERLNLWQTKFRAELNWVPFYPSEKKLYIMWFKCNPYVLPPSIANVLQRTNLIFAYSFFVLSLAPPFTKFSCFAQGRSLTKDLFIHRAAIGKFNFHMEIRESTHSEWYSEKMDDDAAGKICIIGFGVKAWRDFGKTSWIP